MDDASLADLTDAVARGRLTLAELGTVNREELEALHAIAVARMDMGLNADAMTLLAALVTLFPFRARFWRSYGVSLQRCGQLHRATAAYDAALLLDPRHGLTQCHRAEVAYLLGEREKSAATIYQLTGHHDDAVATRAAALWQVIANARRALDTNNGQVSTSSPPEAPVLPAAANDLDPHDDDSFTLTDGRALPLAESRFPTEELSDADAAQDESLDTGDETSPGGFHHTVTSPASPLPEITGSYTKPEGTVITAVERRRHGLPLAEDEITLTSEGGAPPNDRKRTR